MSKRISLSDEEINLLRTLLQDATETKSEYQDYEANGYINWESALCLLEKLT